MIFFNQEGDEVGSIVYNDDIVIVLGGSEKLREGQQAVRTSGLDFNERNDRVSGHEFVGQRQHLTQSRLDHHRT